MGLKLVVRSVEQMPRRDDSPYAFKFTMGLIPVNREYDGCCFGMWTVVNWCKEQFGPAGSDWETSDWVLYIRSAEFATAFKIRWM